MNEVTLTQQKENDCDSSIDHGQNKRKTKIWVKEYKEYGNLKIVKEGCNLGLEFTYCN